jgi:IrrE N-terminal-like domain
MADACPIDIVGLVEFGLPKLIPGFVFSVVGDDHIGSDVLALTRDNPPEIIVRESVYHKAHKQVPWARWVLAHEVGHLVLQHTTSANRHCKLDVDYAEYQANVFAQLLLLPSNLVGQCSSSSEIATKFLVSDSTAKARLKEIREEAPDRIATDIELWREQQTESQEGAMRAKRCKLKFLRGDLHVRSSTRDSMTDCSNYRSGSMAKQPGLDGRHRDANGEIRHKNGNTRVDTLRETYGPDFAKDYRGDMKLETLLDRSHSTSLSEYLKRK